MGKLYTFYILDSPSKKIKYNLQIRNLTINSLYHVKISSENKNERFYINIFKNRNKDKSKWIDSVFNDFFEKKDITFNPLDEENLISITVFSEYSHYKNEFTIKISEDLRQKYRELVVLSYWLFYLSVLASLFAVPLFRISIFDFKNHLIRFFFTYFWLCCKKKLIVSFKDEN